MVGEDTNHGVQGYHNPFVLPKTMGTMIPTMASIDGWWRYQPWRPGTATMAIVASTSARFLLFSFLSPFYLLLLSFVSCSDFVRTSFGAASDNTRTRSERGPNERRRRVEQDWNKSGTRLYKKHSRQ